MAQQIRAKHNYVPSRPDELAFKKKEVLTLVSKVASKGWWIGRNAAGKEGLVPFNYFEDYTPPSEKDPFDELAESWGVAATTSSSATPAAKPVQSAVATPAASSKPAAPTPAATPSPAPAAASYAPGRVRGDDLDLDSWIREIEDVVIEAKPVAAKAAPATQPVKAAAAAPAAHEAKSEPAKAAPHADAARAPAATSPVDDVALWMKRALAAESQLAALVRLYEEEQQKLRDANEAADESDKAVLEMIENARLEKAQWDRLHEAEKEELRARVRALESTSSDPSELAELRAAVARVTRELEEDRALSERELGEEREKHRQAVERANELSSLYETAREQYAKLEQRLAGEQRAHEAAQEELVDVKRRTARVLELVAKQKAALDAHQSGTADAPPTGPADEPLRAELQAAHARVTELQHSEEALRSEIAQLKRAAAELPPPAPVEALAAAPPPPPPPRSPAPDRRSLSKPKEGDAARGSKSAVSSSGSGAAGGGAKGPAAAAAAAPEQKQGFGNMADVAARVAQARALRAKEGPAVGAAAAAKETPAKPAADAGAADSGADGGVSRSRANEILARAKALAAKAKQQDAAPK